MPASLLTPFVYGVVAVVWSGGFVVGKIGVSEVPPLELSAIRFGSAGLLLVAIARLTGARLGTERLGLIVLSAAFGVAGYNTFVFIGLTMAPASDAGLIVPTLIPVLTAIAATTVGERVTPDKILGFALSTLGAAVVVVAGSGIGGSFERERLVGGLLYVAGAACWAAYATIGTITLRTGSPLGVIGLSSLIGAVMLFPLGFLEQGYRDVPSWPTNAWLAIAYLVLFATIIGFVLFYWAVRRFGAGIGAMTSYLVPVGTLIWAAIALGERPAPLQVLGGAVIIVGVRVATRRRPSLAGGL